MVNYKKTGEVVKQAAQFMQKAVQLTLQAKHSRTAIRANWKKVGDGWQPINVTKQKVRANYVASGNLVRSIQPFSQGLEFGVKMDWYGQMVINGRQPFGKNKGGKGIPPTSLQGWANIKGLRPRDPKSGQFIKNNKNNRNAMVFMMNRKIKHFGIEPFDFIKMPRRYTLDKFTTQIGDAVSQDIKAHILK